jgi:o-succinylbenzoate synthase
MRVAAARLRPYALPLVRPWVAASATIEVRRGALLALEDADGVVGWGDCAPLPSSGEAGQERVFADLAALVRGLPDRDGHDVLDSLAAFVSPEVRWAAETALLDLEARRRGLPLARLLSDHAKDMVPVNAALGPLDPECAARAEEALEQGFAIAKIKVGLGPLVAEVTALRSLVRRTDGRLRLRLDANRAWNETDARRFLEAVERLPIDGVEEPLAAPTASALAALQAAIPFALAVDESLPHLGAEAVLGAVRRLVIKPARLGGVSATLALAARALDAGMEVVLTSVVDSAVGVAAAAHVAAALPPGPAHGLATLAWLAEDVADGPSVVAGQLDLGMGAGLGLVPRGEPAQR